MHCKNCSFYKDSQNPSLHGKVCKNPKLTESERPPEGDSLHYPYLEQIVESEMGAYNPIHVIRVKQSW